MAAALAAAALAAAALITLALLSPAPATVDVGSPGDAAQVANFYGLEGEPGGSFRWSGPGSALLIPAAYDGPLALELRLRTLTALPAGAPPLELGRDGQRAAEFVAGPSYRVYHILLPPDTTPEPGPLRLEPLAIEAPPSYAPGDPRPLGVALDTFALKPAPGAPPLSPIAARALAIGAGLAAAWAALALAGALPPRLDLAAALIAGAGAALALWAWRDPLGFAAAVPTPGPGSVAAGLAIALAVRWGGRAARLGSRWPWATLFVGLLLGWTLQDGSVAEGGLGAVILILLPGVLAAWALFPDEREPAALLFLGACGGVAVAALLMLALHALPGGITPAAVLVATGALSVAILLAAEVDDRRAGRYRNPDPPPPALGWPERVTALAVFAAVGLRLWALGGAEFQGDEARAMLLALGAVGGEDGVLLTHTKGPVEALLPAAALALAQSGAEWVARLPFAAASLGTLAGAITLLRALAPDGPARRWGVALVAALLAVDGLAVAFGRIVQYQSVVMLMMAGAFWCCWRFYSGAPHPLRSLLAAAALLAVGILAHYDAGLVTPALAWLVLAGGRRRGWRARDWLLGLGAPALVGAALLASFFLPYVLGPSFASTADYLAGRAGEGDAGGPPFNNLPIYFAILSFYSAPPLTPLLVVGVLGAAAAHLIGAWRPRGAGVALAALLGVALLVQWLAPQAYGLPGGGSWAGLAFGLPLLALCAAPAAPAGVRATALWLTAALGALAFLVAEPRTHFYAAHVPAVLLAGLAVATPAPRLARHIPRIAAAAAALLLAGGGAYGQLVYLRQFPEYQRAFPAARPDLLRTVYGDTLPEAGYFGFPRRDGWKAAAELYRSGLLAGGFDTNQNRWLAGWYMAGAAAQCKGGPAHYLSAEAEWSATYPPEYALAAEVRVGPERGLAIYALEEPAGGPALYRLEQLQGAFNTRPVSPFPVTPLLTEDAPRCREPAP
jgi:hypothetical protein